MPRVQGRLVSHGLQERGQFTDVFDEQHAVGKGLSLPQSLRADEDGSHAVGERRDDVALEVVADEQHLAGRCSSGGEDKPVKQGIWTDPSTRITLPPG